MGCFIEGHPNIELSVSESKLLFIQNGNKYEKMKKEIKKGKEHGHFGLQLGYFAPKHNHFAPHLAI